MRTKLTLLLLSLFPPVIISSVITVDEFLSSSYDMSQLRLVESFFRDNSECPHVRDELTVLRVNKIDKEGNLVNDTVTVARSHEVEVLMFQDGTRPENDNNDIITLRPRLNCYSQDDPRLIASIKENSLHPPSTSPYNLEGQRTLGDGQPRLLDQRFFMERKKGGFFIEAGAHNGESDSTTLHYELEHGWSGLLVEPVPGTFSELLSKNRRAWSVNTCLSTLENPETVNFSLSGTSGSTMSGILAHNDTLTGSVRMQCLPLYSLLLSLGNPTVDFLSLDVEGAEFQVLKTIPWSQVDIRAISVETQFAGEVMEGGREDIFRLLTAEGYTHLDTIARDDIFVKLDPKQITQYPRPEHILQRRSRRRCPYYKVPQTKLSNHCRLMYPLDYFRPVRVEDLHDCLTRNTCPYDWMSLIHTYRVSASWIVTLSDGCVEMH